MIHLNEKSKKGTYCDRCSKITQMEERVLLRSIAYYRSEEKYPYTSSNHSTKVIKKYGLCESCAEYIHSVLERELHSTN